MQFEYMVKSFVPTITGCGAADMGWDTKRCEQFQSLLNEGATQGWKLHSCEYRQVKNSGCGGSDGQQLICIFERPKA